MSDDLTRHFFGGFVRLHILYHAGKQPICGIEMIAELGRHGYRVGPGTLYPILHDLEQTGYISCKEEIIAGKRRKNYRITKKGQRLVVDARAKLRELVGELVEGRDKMANAKRR